MKYTFLALFLILVTWLSCNKDDPWSDIYWGEASVLSNGELQEARIRASPSARNNLGIAIQIHFFNEQNIQRGGLNLFKIPYELGSYMLSKTQTVDMDSLSGASFATRVADGDVIGDFYDLLEGEIENEVTIDRIEDEEIWGTFQVAFVKDTTYGEGDPTAPDTLIFTDGQFHTKVFE